MIHETNKENKLDVKSVDFDLDKYIKKYIRNTALAQEIRNADIIMLPYSNFKEIIGPMFPEVSLEFYEYLCEVFEENKVEICIEDDDYKEMVLHDEIFNLGLMFINGILFPVIASAIFDYVKAKRGERKVDVKVTFIEKEDNKYKEFRYEGDSKYLVETVENYLEKRNSNED